MQICICLQNTIGAYHGKLSRLTIRKNNRSKTRKSVNFFSLWHRPIKLGANGTFCQNKSWS